MKQRLEAVITRFRAYADPAICIEIKMSGELPVLEITIKGYRHIGACIPICEYDLKAMEASDKACNRIIIRGIDCVLDGGKDI